MDFGTDQLLLDVADYVVGFEVESAEAMKTARYCVNDVLGTCACRPNRRGGGASRARRRTQTHAAAPPRRRATNDAGITALNSPECTKLLGPVVPGQTVPHGAHVPGTDYYLDPVQAAFNIGTCKAWGEYSDSWQGADWISPSDTIAAILAVAEYLSSLRLAKVFPAPKQAKTRQWAVCLCRMYAGSKPLQQAMRQKSHHAKPRGVVQSLTRTW